MHIISVEVGIQILYRRCKNSAAELTCSIRNRINLNVRIKNTKNLEMTENSTNDNNFQTECTPTVCVVDEHCPGFSNAIPTNSSRDTKHADRIQESIINLDKMVLSPNEQNSGEYFNSNYSLIFPQMPTYFNYPIQSQMYPNLNPLIPFNYGETIPNIIPIQQKILDISCPFIPSCYQNENRETFPVHHQFQAMPNFMAPFHNMMFQSTPNFMLNQPTTTCNVLSIDSHRRDFHRRQDVSGGRTGNQKKEVDVISLRKWEQKYDGKNNTPGYIFKLMSYNVLAQDLADMHPYLYRDHNQSAMKWTRSRWPNLFKEIKRINPDVLCLQEVQEDHLESYYSLLHTLGFQGIFKKRTGNQTDGCAIYYKEDILNLVEHTTVEFHQDNVRLLDRDNVGIVAKFAPKLFPAHEFVVATTHLLYNPKRDDVRLAQMQLLLTEVERFSYKKPNSENDCYLPVIITGDFNSPPYSDLHKFVSKRKLYYKYLPPKLLDNLTLVTAKVGITDSCQHADLLEKRKHKDEISRLEELELISINHSDHSRKKESYNVDEKESLLKSGKLSHKFPLKSVYGHGTVQNPEATTYQDEWLTVDYIFYSHEKDSKQDNLRLLARYRLPRNDEMGDTTIPNQSLGSDHLSLIAKFKLEFA